MANINTDYLMNRPKRSSFPVVLKPADVQLSNVMIYGRKKPNVFLWIMKKTRQKVYQ